MPTPPDSTSSSQPSARDLLELLNTIEKTPTRATAALAKRVASQPPKKTVSEALGLAGKTIKAGASPGLYLLQQMGLRTGSGLAGAIDPVIERVNEEMKGGYRFGESDALSQSAAGAAKGVLRMEPPYGKPETAVSDVLRHRGYTRGFLRDIPGQGQRLRALMLATGFNAPVMKGIAEGGEFITGPEGAALGLEWWAGDKINEAARGTGAVINQTGLPDKMRDVGDWALRQPAVKRVSGPIARTFQTMPMVPRKVVNPVTEATMSENARAEALAAVREMAGARGQLEARWTRDLAGAEDVIREGARQFGMTVEERGRYLKTVREHLNRQGVAGLEALTGARGNQPMITPGEADLLRRIGDVLDLSIPATRGATGLRSGRLNEAAERGGEKAVTAINRVKSLARELRQVRKGELPTYGETPGGGFDELSKLHEINRYRTQDRRRELIRAIRDADFATRAFSRVSRHFIPPALDEIQRANLHRYSIDELLGIIDEMDAGVFRPVPLTEAEKIAQVPERQYRTIVRGNPTESGQQARVFDRHGNEIWRGDIPDGVPAERFVREKFPEAVGRGPRGTDAWLTEMGGSWPTWKVHGPYDSPIPRLEQIGREIEDRDKYFVNYLPRYESEELTTKTRALRKGKKSGVSTSIGGKRIASPTTTHEEAERMLRERFVRESREANAGDPATPVKEPLQNLTEALQTHVRTNASSIAKKGFYDRISQSFGVYAPDEGTARLLQAEGWRPLGKMAGATSGMKKEIAERFNATYVPESVWEGIVSLEKALSPVERVGFAKFWHQLLQAEKTYLTTANVRFPIRNRGWEVMASFFRGNKNIRNWIDADKLIMGGYNGKKVPGFDLTGEELVRYLEREGVIGPDLGLTGDITYGGKRLRSNVRDLIGEKKVSEIRGYNIVRPNGEKVFYAGKEDDLPKIVEKFGARFPGERGFKIEGVREEKIKRVLKGRVSRRDLFTTAGQDILEKAQAPLRGLQETNITGEARSRVAHWLWSMRDKKMDRRAARAEVAFTNFDYQRDFLTASEQRLREWVPFYTWFRRIVPFAVQNSIQRPGELARVGMIQAHINALNGVTPEEMEYLGRSYLNSVGIVLPDEPGQRPGTKKVLNVPFGYSDPSQFMTLSEDLGDVAPLGKFTGPLRGAASTIRPSVQLPLSFLYAMGTSGEKFTGEIVKLPATAMLLPDDVKERLGVSVRNGIPWGPSTLIPVVRYMQGGVGEAAGGLLSSDPRVRAKTWNWLRGFSVDPAVPVQQNKESQAILQWKLQVDKWGRARRGLRRMMLQDAIGGAPSDATKAPSSGGPP